MSNHLFYPEQLTYTNLRRILMIHGETNLLDLIKAAFKEHLEVQFNIMNHPRIAIQIAAHRPPELLITDIFFPMSEYFDGEYLIRTIREFCPGVKVIVFSSLRDEAVIAHFISKVGVDAYLSGPLDLAVLLNKGFELLNEPVRVSYEYKQKWEQSTDLEPYRMEKIRTLTQDRKGSAMSDVLIVDDEQDIGEYLCTALEEEGIQSRFTTKGEEALQLIESEKFKVFVIDMKLSTQVTGLDLIKAIQQRVPKAIIVGMSGYIEEHLKELAMRQGVHAYLEKPTDMGYETFTNKMKELLSKANCAFNEPH